MEKMRIRIIHCNGYCPSALVAPSARVMLVDISACLTQKGNDGLFYNHCISRLDLTHSGENLDQPLLS
ncbi:hypothetical protein AAC387_Pa04g0683 [Persea americana]